MTTSAERKRQQRQRDRATRDRWARLDAEVAAKNSAPETPAEVEQSRSYLRAAFGLKDQA